MIYASLYDALDFGSINVNGKHRMIELTEAESKIHTNPVLEDSSYNLDFPIQWNNTVILRNIYISEQETYINGFLWMDGLDVKQKLLYENLQFCGEPAVCYDAGGHPYLVSLAYNCNSTMGFFVLIH